MFLCMYHISWARKSKSKCFLMSYIFFENVKTEVEVGKNAKSGLIILVKNQKCLSEKNQAEGRFLRNDSWLLLTKKPAFDPFKNLQSTSIPLTLFCLKKWRFLWQVIEKKRFITVPKGKQMSFYNNTRWSSYIYCRIALPSQPVTVKDLQFGCHINRLNFESVVSD